MEKETSKNIREIAFRFFLEKGYEAANVRDISKAVGIKSASLYFHYKSKEELFFSIYDEIIKNNLDYLKNTNSTFKNSSPDQNLFLVFNTLMDFYSKNIVTQKFILRFHLFPPEAIISRVREKYNCFINEGNIIYKKLIVDCIESGKLNGERSIEEYLFEYKIFESYQTYRMIEFNIKTSEKEIKKQWDNFWNNL